VVDPSIVYCGVALYSACNSRQHFTPSCVVSVESVGHAVNGPKRTIRKQHMCRRSAAVAVSLIVSTAATSNLGGVREEQCDHNVATVRKRQ
jgi:hypothetical protein